MELSRIINENYQLDLEEIRSCTPKTFFADCKLRNRYFIKQVVPATNEKFNFLASAGVDNIVYPLLNRQRKYVSSGDNSYITVSDFIYGQDTLVDALAVSMAGTLKRLHENTMIPRQLSQLTTRPKLDEIIKQLDYKFKALEQYIRTLETRSIDQNAMLVLGKYHYILDAKNELIRLQKRIILAVKDRESVNFSFVHNNPRLEHLLLTRNQQYLTSLENGKIGIGCLDMAKFYVENSYLNIDFKALIVQYYQQMDNDFYYDYFRYLVLLIIIKKIQINGVTYVSAESFEHAVDSIKRYFSLFQDYEKKENVNSEL